MVRVRNYFKMLTINKKLMLTYVPIVIIMVICLVQFGTTIRKNSIKELCETKVQLLKHVSDKIDYLNKNIINVSNSYLFDINVQKFLNVEYGENLFDRNIRYRNMEETISEQKNVFGNLIHYTTIYGFDEDAYITNSPVSTKEMDDARVLDYIDVIGKRSSQIVWMDTKEYGGKYIFSAARYIMNVRTGKPSGMIIFDYEDSMLDETYKDYLSNEEIMYIVNENGQILSSSITDASKYKEKFNLPLGEMLGYVEGYFEFEENGSIYCFVKNSSFNLYVISELPTQLARDYYPFVLKYFIIFVILLIIIYILITISMSKYITYPLKKLIISMKRYKNAEISSDELCLEKVNYDEITYLEEEYIEMIDRLNNLIIQIELEQKEKKTLEMKALQNQINPHFLYNTLLSIRYLNRIGEQKKTDESIKCLVGLLVNLFRKDKENHLIGDELELLKNYITIQQLRYGHNFEVEYHCKDDALDSIIPKLILQPLIENSIFHGLSTYEDGGKIDITLEKNVNMVFIVIRDNGIGLLNNKRARTKEVSHGVGLENTKKRLELSYGSDFIFNIREDEYWTTKIEIVIPYERGL
ncbi:MAG: sensor histidine kinase [Lachnospirales bacterium]